ncbi:MAG: hypothetical protein IT289_12480 [Oligoflexia bacterium]|nr:hypothetical protein [Oligoflexia bacterium]
MKRSVLFIMTVISLSNFASAIGSSDLRCLPRLYDENLFGGTITLKGSSLDRIKIACYAVEKLNGKCGSVIVIRNRDVKIGGTIYKANYHNGGYEDFGPFRIARLSEYTNSMPTARVVSNLPLTEIVISGSNQRVEPTGLFTGVGTILVVFTLPMDAVSFAWKKWVTEEISPEATAKSAALGRKILNDSFKILFTDGASLQLDRQQYRHLLQILGTMDGDDNSFRPRDEVKHEVGCKFE